MALTEATTEPRAIHAVLVRHDQIDPSPTNPRKKFVQKTLEELAATMGNGVGILEPLVVRIVKPGRYEIIAGERRWRAAKIAGLADVPVVVRTVSDAQVITLQLIENKGREDIHPLDEARAIDRLLKISPRETPKTIAATIGMSERYVQNRLHYVKLAADVQKAFEEDRITPGHADLIVRLKPEDQKRALKACFTETFDYDGGYAATDAVEVEEDATPTGRRERTFQLVSVRELDRWIKGSVRLEVGPKVGELDFYPEVKQAIAEAAVGPLAPLVEGRKPSPAATLLQVTDSYEYWGKDKPAPLTRNEWEPVGKKKCEHGQRAVIVLGKGRGEVLDVCLRDSGCATHFPPPPKAARPDKDRKLSAYELKQQAQERAKRRWGKIRKVAYKALAARVAKGVTVKEAIPALAFGISGWHAGNLTTLEKLVIAAADRGRQYITRGDFQKYMAGPLGLNLKALELQAFPPKRKAIGTLDRASKQLIRQLHPKKRRAGKKR